MSVSKDECNGLLSALGLYNPAVPGDCATLSLKSERKRGEKEVSSFVRGGWLGWGGGLDIR